METETSSDLDAGLAPLAIKEAMRRVDEDYPGINAAIVAARTALSHLVSFGMATHPEEL